MGGTSSPISNGVTWTTQATPGLSSGGILVGVSCSNATTCTAVGQTIAPQGPLVERWNGSTWTVQSVAIPGNGIGTLEGVSCPTADVCTAVGALSARRPFAERWNGKTWAIQSLPNPSGSKQTALDGVKCRGTGPCTTVGQANHDPSDFPTVDTLAERWNGATWSIQKTPSP